jgi:hypothetical protein
MCQIDVRALFNNESHPHGCFEVSAVSFPAGGSVDIGIGACPSTTVTITNAMSLTQITNILFPQGNCDDPLDQADTVFCFEQTDGQFTISFEYVITAPGCTEVRSNPATITIEDSCDFLVDNANKSCPSNAIPAEVGDRIYFDGRPNINGDVLQGSLTWSEAKNRNCNLTVTPFPANYNTNVGGTSPWSAHIKDAANEGYLEIPSDIACGECVELTFDVEPGYSPSGGTGCADCDGTPAALAVKGPETCSPNTGQSLFISRFHHVEDGDPVNITAQLSLDIDGIPYTTGTYRIASYQGVNSWAVDQTGLQNMVNDLQAQIDLEGCSDGCIKAQVIALTCDVGCCAVTNPWTIDLQVSVCDYCGVGNLNAVINQGCEPVGSPIQNTQPCTTIGNPSPPNFARYQTC